MATAAEFDTELAERIDRIERNPNPKPTFKLRLRRALRWPRTLNREAAFDSVRNVLMVVGAGTILGDFATMRLWLVVPMLAVAGAVWYIDYLRHF
jgi:hypothetical protein